MTLIEGTLHGITLLINDFLFQGCSPTLGGIPTFVNYSNRISDNLLLIIILHPFFSNNFLRSTLYHTLKREPPQMNIVS